MACPAESGGARYSAAELAGYQRALDWIFSRKRTGPITPDAIRKLHAFVFGGSGEWKTADNKIEAILADGQRRVSFVPTAASATPRAMDRLCRNYNRACAEHRVAPLLIAATFVFDLSCIHPFRGGNGRVSRLAAALLLRSHGIPVFSFEDVVDRSRSAYYRALAECSRGWHEGRNEIVPWWNYFLGLVQEALWTSSPRIERSTSS